MRNGRPRPIPRRAMQIGKMLAYFVMLILGARILEEVLQELSTSEYAGELSRVSGMAASILDVNKNLDDLIVTFFALAITFLLVLPVSWVHMITKGNQSDPSLTQTLIVLSVIVAGVMLLLEDNLARAFSLVGVVAAVRYRNTLKDPKDAVYVFLSLGLGMACGFQAYHVALLLSLFECAILLVLWVYQAGGPPLRTDAEAEDEDDEDDDDDELRHQKVKQPNAIITVQTTGQASASATVRALMDEHRGNWRLVGSQSKDGLTTLEYLGRLPRKRTPPASFLERLRRADPDVRFVAFRSLRADEPATDEPVRQP